MKIATWNVNGVRAREAQLQEFIAAEQPDVLCLQEIKATIDQLPMWLCEIEGYSCYWHGAKGYSGVALHVRQAAVPAKPEFMQPGNRTGNPNYMAPEIVRRQSTDQRVDVFAFGVTAYEIMTYQLPWSRGAKGDVAMMHATTPPAEITKYRPQINPVLGKAITRCIEQERDKRFASMDLFLKAIAGVVDEDAPQ